MNKTGAFRNTEASPVVKFEKVKELNILFWWLDAGVTPVLIPNTEVKPCSADGTGNGRVGSRQNKIFNFFKFLLPGLSLVVPMVLVRGE